MNSFVILAEDAPDMLARRLAVRPQHLENLEKARLSGHIACAAATLDAQGNPNGSALIASFEDQAALDAWLASEPYVTTGVWGKITIHPARLAPSFQSPGNTHP
jgi:uncharacterized protein YciI